MKNKDKLHRFVFENFPVRGEIVQLDATWKTILATHPYPPVVRELLGEAIAAVTLLAATIKFEGSISLQLQGEGPVTMLVAQCNSEKGVRGTISWRGDVVSGPLYELCKNGYLVITIDPAMGKEKYQGIVALGEGNLAQAIAGYFDQSEQLSTQLWLFADDQQAAGMLLQRMPDEEQEADDWNRVKLLANTLKDEELLRLDVEDILHRLFHEDSIRLFDAEPVAFRCSCSRNKIKWILKSMGYEELQSIIAEQKLVAVDCEFCKRTYQFDSVDIEQLFAAKHNPSVTKTQH